MRCPYLQVFLQTSWTIEFFVQPLPKIGPFIKKYWEKCSEIPGKNKKKQKKHGQFSNLLLLFNRTFSFWSSLRIEKGVNIVAHYIIPWKRAARHITRLRGNIARLLIGQLFTSEKQIVCMFHISFSRFVFGSFLCPSERCCMWSERTSTIRMWIHPMPIAF